MTGDPWVGPAFEDPALTRLAEQLAHAHRLVGPLPPHRRRRLIRHLLTITDLAKRDAVLAARRLDAFIEELPAELAAEDPSEGPSRGPDQADGPATR